MTDTKTNTEKTKRVGSSVGSRLVTFLSTLLFMVVLALNLYPILKGNWDVANLGFVIVAVCYLIADSVRAGINMAIAGLPVQISTGDDTPTREDA